MGEHAAIVIDARGHRCPTPTLRLRRALEGVAAGAVVELRADDPLARIDVAHFCAQAGHTLLDCRQEGAGLRFSVRKGSSAGAADRGSPPA